MVDQFSTWFAASGFPALLEQFGESVVYHKKHGGSRSITGIVNRNPPEQFDAAGDVVTPKLQVSCHNDSTLGIAIDELNTSGDELEVAIKIGLDERKLSITNIAEWETGILVLDLR